MPTNNNQNNKNSGSQGGTPLQKSADKPSILGSVRDSANKPSLTVAPTTTPPKKK